MKQILLLTALLVLTISCWCQTPKKLHWSNYHGPKKVEYFKKGDTITSNNMSMIVTKPRQLNRQMSYIEQGFRKTRNRQVNRIYKRNCKSLI